MKTSKRNSKNLNSALDFADQLNPTSQKDFVRNSDEFIESATLEYDEECYFEKVAEEQCDRQIDGLYDQVSFSNH